MVRFVEIYCATCSYIILQPVLILKGLLLFDKPCHFSPDIDTPLTWTETQSPSDLTLCSQGELVPLLPPPSPLRGELFPLLPPPSPLVG